MKNNINTNLSKIYNEINMKKFLSSYKNREIIYFPNPGNAGDTLIAYGTLCLFNELGLNYIFGKISDKYNNKLLFFGGGGNLVGLYKNCKNFIEMNKDNNEIVILPHTIKDEDELIKSFDENIKIICREKTSYSYVSNLIKNKDNVFLSKDMAFYINIKKYNDIKNNKICNCFRTDSEKTNIIIPKDNVDLSKILNKSQSTSNPKIITDVALSVFEYLSKYEIINTNRLHMAIAGSLLNKKVIFYDNSYYKNKAIFDYSIKNIYKNTKFTEAKQQIPKQQIPKQQIPKQQIPKQQILKKQILKHKSIPELKSIHKLK